MNDFAAACGPATALPELGPEEIQVWTLQVGIGEAGQRLLQACRALLSDAELARVDRVRPGVARDERLVGRACLRVLLGAALGKKPQDLEISEGSHGKPAIHGVEFNVSHSHGLIFIALCRSAAVGVDLESIRPVPEAMEIAERHFAAAEREALRLDSSEEVGREFFRIWTRKEAVVKAHGQGLTLGLESFDVSGAVEKTILLPHGQDRAIESFHVSELSAPSGFVAALAVSGDRGKVGMMEFPSDWLQTAPLSL